jgi:hypothetical protein
MTAGQIHERALQAADIGGKVVRPEDFLVRVESSGGAETVTIGRGDGRWVRLHSTRDPVREADGDLARAFVNGEPSLVVSIGLGFGYLLDAVAARSQRTRVLAIEPFAASVAHLKARSLVREWLASGRLTLLVAPQFNGSDEAWRTVVASEANPHVVFHPVIHREFPKECAQAYALSARIVQGARENERARRTFSGRYLLQSLENLPRICREGDVNGLTDVFPSVPAAVIGAGPSLDSTLHTLRALSGRILIVATDTTLRPLLAAGIEPQIVVAVDPSELNARHLQGIAGAKHTRLVAEGSMHPSVFEPFGGRTFFCRVTDHEPWRWLRTLNLDCGHARAWGSVLTVAFDLAHRAGCNPIVFFGADMAYTGGLPYCRNTIYERDWGNYRTTAELSAALLAGLASRPTCTEPDIGGQPVLTAPHFLQFRDWLVSRASATDRRVLNATGGGILHGDGVEQIRGEELAFEPLSLDVNRLLSAAWQSTRDRQQAAAPSVSAAARKGVVPLEAWLAATLGTVSANQVAAALATAANGFGRLEEAP